MFCTEGTATHAAAFGLPNLVEWNFKAYYKNSIKLANK